MKKNKIIVPILFVFALFLSSCESDLNNTITVRNISQSELTINFRGHNYEIPAGRVVNGDIVASIYVIKDIPKGIYAYTTIYGVPIEAEKYASEGDLAGQVEFSQDTQALIIYSSAFSEGSYTIFATITTDTDLSEEDGITTP